MQLGFWDIFPGHFIKYIYYLFFLKSVRYYEMLLWKGPSWLSNKWLTENEYPFKSLHCKELFVLNDNNFWNKRKFLTLSKNKNRKIIAVQYDVDNMTHYFCDCISSCTFIFRFFEISAVAPILPVPPCHGTGCFFAPPRNL